MQPLWSLCIHFSERLPEDDLFISFNVFHPRKYAGVLSMQFDDVWRVPQHVFFRSWTSSGGSGSFTCAGKPHSWWKWMEKLFICLTLFDNWLDSWTWLFWCDSFKLATQDFVTTCYQLLPTVTNSSLTNLTYLTDLTISLVNSFCSFGEPEPPSSPSLWQIWWPPWAHPRDFGDFGMRHPLFCAAGARLGLPGPFQFKHSCRNISTLSQGLPSGPPRYEIK